MYQNARDTFKAVLNVKAVCKENYLESIIKAFILRKAN